MISVVSLDSWDKLSKKIIDYEMATHVFGEALPPLCFNFDLRNTAGDNRSEYPADLARILQRNFYLNATLKGFQTVTEAKDIIKKTKYLWEKGGFNLTKFTSNSEEVLK